MPGSEDTLLNCTDIIMIKGKPLKTIPALTAAAFLIITGSCAVQKDITPKELTAHVKYLSSDDLKGRETGAEGDSLAAEYIRKELAAAGMKPLTGDGFQRFSVTKRLRAGSNNRLSFNGRDFREGEDFSPLSFSSVATLTAPAVFAGYGFSISNDSLKWNDYEGLDVKGKWVIVLRSDPEPDNLQSPYSQHSGDRSKALVAKDQGAAGVLMVSGAAFDPKDVLDPLSGAGNSAGIPVLRIKRNVADMIFSNSGRKTEQLEKEINSTKKPQSFASGTTVTASADIVSETAGTRNVVMVLPGQDEVLKNEYIVFGAHFDHLGMGGQGSSSRAVDTVGVHHGADDNASGVALMIEMAERFALTEDSHKRSIVAVAFSGEEMGLLGSKYYTENPGIDLTKVNAMINLDMVGRIRDSSKTLQVGGVGTAEGLKDLVVGSIDTSVVSLTLSEEGYGPSDHSSFYGKNIPVLFFTTGAHLDYHTPEDTWDKLNYEGMKLIGDYIYDISKQFADSPGRLQYKESGPKVETSRAMRRRGVTLGIMPDFAGNIKNGLRADFVTPGKPAALGGMKKGDIITAIEGKPVNNIDDYMFRLSQLKAGQTISVEITRNGRKEVLLIQL
jgi:Zn-dependent M28 family amino/carboxypeptidase